MLREVNWEKHVRDVSRGMQKREALYNFGNLIIETSK
jgi:hypothetical protein